MLAVPFSFHSALGVTLGGGRLVEDFSTNDYADYTASTGLWNLVTNAAEAGGVAAGSSARPITFGDGSDGVVDTSGGYSFDTDTHPNGFNFKSVNITGGVVTVTGRNTLVIRSLTTVNITPAILVNGVAGSNGVANDGTQTTGPSGGTAVTCNADGGAGGNAAAGAGSATSGSDGYRSTGSTDPEVGTGGLARNNAAADPTEDATTSSTRPNANFDVLFTCGTGGGGGGGHTNGGFFATGGSGGAGGGRVRVVGVGSVTLGAAAEAKGGDGAAGGTGGGGACAGNSGGGVGGAIWVQSLTDITAPLPDVTAGAGNSNGCIGGPIPGGNPGRTRADAPVINGTITGATATNSTANTAASQSYVVQSKQYDLNTLDAVFPTQASIQSTVTVGTATVTFAGSADGSSFSSYTSDLTSLSGKGYRYLKFKVTIDTGAGGATTPRVTRISLDFKDAGIKKIDLKLSPGCGTLTKFDDGNHGDGGSGLVAQWITGWLAFWLVAYASMRSGSVRHQLHRLISRRRTTR